MKKHVLSIFLSLTMVLTMIPVFGITAIANDSESVDGVTEIKEEDIITNTYENEKGAAVTELSGSETVLTVSGGALNTGSYVLNDDITLQNNITVASGKTVSIDLNGHVLTGNGSGTVIRNQGTLTIKDSNPNEPHYFYFSKDGLWTLKTDANDEEKAVADKASDIDDETSLVVVYGGVITGGSINGSGGGIYSNKSLTVKGCNIIGNKATSGGGIIASGSGTATIENTKIYGNVATSSGAGFNNYMSTSTYTGGEIMYNYASSNGGGIYNGNDGGSSSGLTVDGVTIRNNITGASGGGIYSGKAGSTLVVKNATITGNTSTYESGGLYVAAGTGTVTFSGTTIIKDNSTKSGKSVNLALATGRTISISEPSEGMCLCITAVDKKGQIVTNTGDYSGYFVGDDYGYEAVYNSSTGYTEFAVKEVIKISDASDIEAALKSSLTTQTWKLQNDINGVSITIPSGWKILLNLNDKVLTGKSDSGCIINQGTLTIDDTSSSQTNKYFSVDDSGLWKMSSETTEHYITGGAITGAGDHGILNNGILTIKDGNVVGNTTATNGGGIINNKTFTLSGGNIIGNTAVTNGGGLYNDGTLTVSGGLIENNKAKNAGGGIYVKSGTVKMGGTVVIQNNTKLTVRQNVYLPTGQKITVNNVQSGMSVGVFPAVNAESFATGAVETDIVAFVPDDIGYQVVLDSGSLKLAEKEAIDIYSEADMRAALQSSDSSQVWNIKNDIELAKGLGLSKQVKALTVNGNGYAIRGKESTTGSGNMINFGNYYTEDVKVVVNDITLASSGLFEHVLCVDRNKNCGKSEVTLNNVTVDHTTNGGGVGGGAPIICNSSDIFIKGVLDVITSSNSWYAVNLDSTKNGATLTFENDSCMIVTDNRNEINKTAPIITFDIGNGGSCSVSGDFVNNKMTSVTSGDEPVVIRGYNLNSDVSPVVDAAYYASLTLNESININFSMKSIIKSGFDKDKLKIFVDNKEISSKDIQYDYSGETGIISTVLAAKAASRMGEAIHVKVAYDNTVVKRFNYSVKDYCITVLSQENKSSPSEYTNLGKLCYAALNYGACAQMNFNYDTANLVNVGYVNENLSDTVIVDPVESIGFIANDVITQASTFMTLGSEISLNIQFTSLTKLTVDNFTVVNNLYQIVNADRLEVIDKGNNIYVFKIKNIGASKLSRWYQIKCDIDGTENDVIVNYSPYTYCLAAQTANGEKYTNNLKTLCKAIYLYGEAAKAYTAKGVQ